MALRFHSEAHNLKEILEKGATVRTVCEWRGVLSLEISKPVQALADSVISMDTAAAQYLTVACTNCYGLELDPDVAFSNAVKAVEAN